MISKTGNELICDTIDGTSSKFSNTHWFVVRTSNDPCYFHNSCNYTALKTGKIIIIPSSITNNPPIEAEFRIQDVLGSSQAIYLESVQMPRYFLSFDDEPLSEMKLKTTEKSSQFLQDDSHCFFDKVSPFSKNVDLLTHCRINM